MGINRVFIALSVSGVLMGGRVVLKVADSFDSEVRM